ncbi:myelocytomatosis oncogene homolog [Mobula birostris]|uniref:myelocytomatosis oncogene homolog n=1 Tax=Mobula birostris TaxID=1983395 RepID=UPI003B28D0AB
MPEGTTAALEELLPTLLDTEGWPRAREELLQMLPTPPQSPKDGQSSRVPSKSDQLELMSELLLEDEDFVEQGLQWELEPVTQDGVWGSLLAQAELDWLTESLPFSSSLLADIEAQIFQAPVLSPPPQHPAGNLEPDSEAPFPCDSLQALATDSDEEVDVVNVEKLSLAGRSEMTTPGTRSQTLSRVRHCALDIHQQHNYAAPSPLLSLPPLPKRARTDGCLHSAKTTGSIFGLRGSDFEEEERRRTHNVLERQRRNELKRCLLALRDQMPDLSTNSKASKVVILRKATELVGQLQREQLKLQADRNRLQRKQQQLRRRLQRLHRVAK